jgi:hypothetical protein
MNAGVGKPLVRASATIESASHGANSMSFTTVVNSQGKGPQRKLEHSFHITTVIRSCPNSERLLFIIADITFDETSRENRNIPNHGHEVGRVGQFRKTE